MVRRRDTVIASLPRRRGDTVITSPMVRHRDTPISSNRNTRTGLLRPSGASKSVTRIRLLEALSEPSPAGCWAILSLGTTAEQELRLARSPADYWAHPSAA